VTGQTLGALLAGGLLGARRGAGSLGLYLLAGALGLPVFAGGAAGFEHLAGPTGGYLVGLVAAAGIAGWAVERGWARSVPRALAAMLVASAAVFAFGVPWLAVSAGVGRALQAGLVPFLPGALLKAALAAAVVVLVARWTPALGVALFAFIPLVLYLFVGHPEPVAASLAFGLALMLGHRFLAAPYPALVRERRCLWCNRRLPATWESLTLAARGGPLEARTCPRHRAPAARFFSFLAAARAPLALGIFLPLLLLLAALAAAALGRPGPLPVATALFRLAIGLTVITASLAYPLAAERRPPAVPFPVHNFFLLGVRPLLWIFRIVGVWWLVAGARFLLDLVP
jgi:biotin transport system substrate-specific component